MNVSRRQLLKGALATAAASAAVGVVGGRFGSALAIGPQQKVQALRIRHGGGSDVHAGSLEVLLEETRLRTSVDTSELAMTVDPTSASLHDSLFAVVVGNGPFAFTDDERQRLSRWLGLGGFLLFDNAGRTAPDQGFDRSARAELKKLIPEGQLERVSPEHVIYRTFYRLDYPAGRAIFQPYVEGVRMGGRYGAILCHNDLLGALARPNGRQFSELPTPGGETQREMAMRFGVNLVMYAACLHYKDDQAHLNFLLHRRKWKIRPPP
jgi:hypothetical protein